MNFIDLFAGIGGFRLGMQRAGLSDTQLYKQAGNAVTVPVIYEIAKRLRVINNE